MHRRFLVSALLASLLLSAEAAAADDRVAPTQPGTAENFELVGRNDLLSRGMNAAPAVYDDPATGRTFVYVGSRTDGSHPNAGVLVVDASTPSSPRVVNQIGPPNEGNVGETSRELRVWPQQKLLAVMNFGCSAILHACASTADLFGTLFPTIKFYDLTDPAAPTLVSTYTPSRTPHEMYLWVDPKRPARALLYLSRPTSIANPKLPNLIVTDISRAREGAFTEVASWNGNDQFTAQDRQDRDVRLHSMALSADGTRAYLAYLGGGFLVLDTSDLAAAVADPQLRLLTPPANSPRWPNQTAHSAVKVPGRNLVLTTDEVYGDLLDPLVRPQNEFGCPWGWVHLVDIADEARPALVGEFRTFENEDAYCRSAAGQDPLNTTFTAYSAHNPTVLPGLALVTWHSGGLQAIDIRRPSRPRQSGFFSPAPLGLVATEDPALSLGENKVVAWSYPIIDKGLIYLVDIRNGLYVLRYTGRGHRRVDRIGFYEGNSNLGDAARLGG